MWCIKGLTNAQLLLPYFKIPEKIKGKIVITMRAPASIFKCVIILENSPPTAPTPNAQIMNNNEKEFSHSNFPNFALKAEKKAKNPDKNEKNITPKAK